MDYTKFYTPIQIASLLIRQLKIAYPEKVIDICCGSHNLLNSAGNRWKKAKLTGVDVIGHSAVGINCIQGDGRQYALEHEEEYQLVLANPPFGYVKEKNKFLMIYEGKSNDLVSSRLEIEMLFANLKVLDRNGTLLIIMPSAFVNAEHYKKYRKYLALEYHIQNIISLPEETFGKTKISTYVLIIKNQNPKGKKTFVSEIKYIDGEYAITNKELQPRKLVLEGIWDNRFVNNTESIFFDFRRGNISSNLFITQGIPVLHTAKSAEEWKPSIRYIEKEVPHMVYAEKGDIIVSRVGKSAGQWTVYYGDKIAISDCLFRIKDLQGEIGSVLTGHRFDKPLKGVATRYITMEDFYTWYMSLAKEFHII
ncbi:MAG: SAM-dependent DNA methyltransferase [Lachnospiraceae bacterium]|nr:SAM-dependent DNA methyltransferase [Lachnospiraceae bacterium]